MATPPQPDSTTANIFRTLQYNQNKDTPSDTRNVLLIVTALVIAVTFQAGISPPGGWQVDKDGGQEEGRAIYSDQQGAFYTFLISNTLAFSTSILILVSLTYKFPFQFELWTSVISMFVTYGSAIFAIAPEENFGFPFLLATAAVPFGIRFVVEVFKRWKRK